jgi:penicillin-binding protein 2X
MEKIKELLKKQRTVIENRKRVGITLLLLTFLLFFLFTTRFTYIVATGKVAGVSLAKKSRELYTVHESMDAKRGSIYDKAGNVLVEDSIAFSLYAVLDQNYTDLDGKKMYVQQKDWQTIAAIFAEHLSMNPQTTLKQLEPRNNSEGKAITTVEFGLQGKNLNFETKTKIEEALKQKKVTGIFFREEKERGYRVSNFASNFIGVTTKEEKQEETGIMGIEEAYNKQLSGTDGFRNYQKHSAFGDVKPGSVQESKPVNGTDIYTTLESNLQLYLEELLDQTVQDYSPETITATLMEAKTGNIIATSQRPSFALDTRKGLGENEYSWRNILLEDTYEPGSTMKTMMTAAAFEENKFNETEVFPSGNIDVDGRRINDWNAGVGEGDMTFRQGFAWSSNVGMVTLQQRMPDLWQAYMEKFGFGQSTNFGLSGEAVGKIQNQTTVDRAMTSYGQGISVTHLQMLQAYTAIANDGKMLKPNLISKMIAADGKMTLIEPQVIGTPISANTAKKMLSYMKDVTTDPKYGKGQDYAIEGINVSAKTGTAEFFENGSYQEEEYLHSVVTITPTEDPKYIFYMTIKKPTFTDASANQIIAKVANNLVQRAIISRE